MGEWDNLVAQFVSSFYFSDNDRRLIEALQVIRKIILTSG